MIAMRKARRGKDKAAEQPLESFVSLPEAAKIADVTPRHMQRLAEGGVVTAIKVGRNWLVDRAAAAAFERSPSVGRPRKA
jgi:hypothetical protein